MFAIEGKARAVKSVTSFCDEAEYLSKPIVCPDPVIEQWWQVTNGPFIEVACFEIPRR